MLTVIKVLFSLAIAVFALLAFGEGMVQEALHAARLRSVATQIDIKLPSAPEAAKPGEIVLVTGAMQGETINLGADNPSFPGAFIVSRHLDRRTGLINQRWRSVESKRWISASGRLGPWTLSPAIYNRALDGSRPAQPQREFTAPRVVEGTAVMPRSLAVDGNALQFNAGGELYRLDYQVWSGNQPFTVLAQVANDKSLVPFLVPGLQGAPFSAMAAGAHPDPSFLLELSDRDVLSSLGILVLLVLFGALGWFAVLRRIWDQGFFRTVGDSLWRGAAMVAPMMLIAFWPATNTNFIWIAAASVGGAAGVLFLLIGLVYAEWTE
jgi:hypothetical protein